MIISKQETFDQYFFQLKKLNIVQRPKLSLASYFFAGYASLNYLNTPKGLVLIFEAFEMLQKMEEANVIADAQKERVFHAILDDPKIRIEKEISKILNTNLWDEEHPTTDFTFDIFGKVKSLIAKYEDGVAVQTHRLEPIDLVFWGLLTHEFSDQCADIFERILAIKELEVKKELTDEQKADLLRLFYLNVNVNVAEYITSLKSNDSLVLKSPSTSANTDEQEIVGDIPDLVSVEIDSSNKEESKSLVSEKTIECKICQEVCTDESGIGLELCGHSFHKACLNQYLEVQMADNKFPIACPQMNCSSGLSNSDVKNILSDEDFKKFHRLSVAHFVNKNTSAIFQCPTPDCVFKLFYVDTDQKDVNCPLCHNETCIACRELSHPGTPCEVNQFIKIARDLGLKACPSCRHWVEKVDGCNHMTCSCGYEFCYQCGRIYDSAQAEEGGYICADGNCDEDDYYKDFEKLLSLQEG